MTSTLPESFDLDGPSDPISKIHFKLDFLMDLKRMGEEPHEIEYLVDELAKLLSVEFVKWLEQRKIEYPADLASIVVSALTRYVFFVPGRRAFSPLTCGKKLREDFLEQAAFELELPKEAAVVFEEGLRLFVDFRPLLKGC